MCCFKTRKRQDKAGKEHKEEVTDFTRDHLKNNYSNGILSEGIHFAQRQHVEGNDDNVRLKVEVPERQLPQGNPARGRHAAPLLYGCTGHDMACLSRASLP